jgi:hypothetical protein
MHGNYAADKIGVKLLCTICDRIFMLYIISTMVVLLEVHEKYICEEQKAIDLSPIGGLNYNGIDTV